MSATAASWSSSSLRTSSLTRLDRAWLDPLPKGSRRLPQFRSWHPGKTPRPLNAEETVLLLELLKAFRAWWEVSTEHIAGAVWDTGRIPLVQASPGGFEITLVPQDRAEFDEPAPTLPEAQLEQAIALPRSQRRFELDCFCVGSIGSPDAGGQAAFAALLVDAKSAFAFQPCIDAVDQASGGTAAMLATALLNGILQAAARPRHLTVRTPELAATIAEIARALDIELAVSPHLPALDHVRDRLLQHLLGPLH